jgi:hypothetical protein
MSDYCPFCGTQLEEKVTFCPNCGAHIDEKSGSSSSATTASQPQIVTDMPVTGTPQQHTYSPPPTQSYQPVTQVYVTPPPPQGNSDADSALFLGIGGLFCFPIILSIPAIIYGFRALQKPNKHATAIIGIVLGFIGLLPLLGLIWIFI